MEAVLIGVAIALVANKIIELVKYLRTRNWNGAVTLLSLFVAGYLALTLAAHSAVAEDYVLPGTTIALGMLDWASLAILGLMLTATGSTIYDFKKALDPTDSAAQPRLLSPRAQGDPQA